MQIYYAVLMPSPTLRFKNFVKKGESHHFARLELGPTEAANLHRHDFLELFWIDGGQGVHILEEKRFAIEPRTVTFVRPEDLHTLGANNPRGSVLLCNLAFRKDSWMKLRQRHPKTIPDWFRRNITPPPQKKPGAELAGFLHRAGLELAASPRTPMMLERFLLNLTFALHLSDGAASPPPTWLSEAAVKVEQEKLFRYEGGTVLARVSGLSAPHVAREVRRHFNKTPTDLINAMRMRYAGKLLTETSREILDICADCGLENVGHFYALFRHYHGATPSAYRRSSRGIVRLSV